MLYIFLNFPLPSPYKTHKTYKIYKISLQGIFKKIFEIILLLSELFVTLHRR